jgi:hypothetical protein
VHPGAVGQRRNETTVDCSCFEAALAAGGLNVDQRIELHGEWRERSTSSPGASPCVAARRRVESRARAATMVALWPANW